jgi:hypothetical protein
MLRKIIILVCLFSGVVEAQQVTAVWNPFNFDCVDIFMPADEQGRYWTKIKL